MRRFITTQTITENIYVSITHNISQRSIIKDVRTKAVLSQAVADLSKAASIVHQAHWYMRGAGFYYLHPKMDELMDGLNAPLDEMSECSTTIGGAPYSTLKEFDENSKLEETTGSSDRTMDEYLVRLVDVHTYLSVLYQIGLDITDEEGDASSNGIFTAAQADAERTIWTLQVERGQAPGIK